MTPKNHTFASIGLVVTGVLVLSGCGTEILPTPASESVTQEEPPVGGYEGWWNATSPSGGNTGLPVETVTVSTATGEILDASRRDSDGQIVILSPNDVNYTVRTDPEWPANSVVIIDTTTNEVIESFSVDSSGNPTK